MTPLKLNRAFALAGISMPTVRAHIEHNLSAFAVDFEGITAKQLAAIIALHHTAYTQGKASCCASVADDAIWIGAGVDKLIPLEALRKMEITHTTKPIPAQPSTGGWSWTSSQWSVTRYTLDHSERV